MTFTNRLNKIKIVSLIFMVSVGCVEAQQDSDSQIINVDDELNTYANTTGGTWHSEIGKLSYFRTSQFDGEMLSKLSSKSLNSIDTLLLGYLSLKEIPDLSFLPSLISLNLSANEISDLSQLTNLNLEQLNIPENPILDITPISKMQTLRSVDLTLCSIVKLPDLSSWKNLIGLGLIETPIRSLRNLETIPSDFTLNIMNCDQLTDIDSLLDARVTTLFIDELNYERLQPWFDENVEKIKEKRPQFNIRFSAGE